MKIRCNFVSNSSSSSFIVNFNINKIFDDVRCIELTEEQKNKISQDDGIIFSEDHYWLTSAISDGDDLYTIFNCYSREGKYNFLLNQDILSKLPKNFQAIEYDELDVGFYPHHYQQPLYIELQPNSGIFILKKHIGEHYEN